ncbi:hypothetical protein JXL21_10835 [Candidatus Bathyarchaeota archaeon]|nr:hypothetical protein [Candidatus Bathyarchaeota archaeon]
MQSGRRVDSLYYEEYEAHPVYNLLVGGAVLMLAYLSLNPPVKMGGVSRVVLALSTLLTVGIYFVFRTLRIEVAGGVLEIGFGFIKTRINLSDVVHVEAVKPPWWRYGGLGLRWGFDGSVAYIIRYGPGIRVVSTKRRPLFFNTRNPDELLRVLDSEMNGLRST